VRPARGPDPAPRALRQRAAPPSEGRRSGAAWLLRIVGILLMCSAAAIALSRAPDRPVESLVARWAPPPSDFIELDGQLVHLRDVGRRSDPLPVVLIHGTSASLHTWDGWVRQLQPHRRVISFDLPGFGLTGPRPDGDYRGDADARFVLALLDRLQVGRAVLGGNSLGGEVAWRVATLAPARVAQLVLVDASGLPAAPGALPLGWRIARWPVAGRLMEWFLPRAMVVQGLVQVYADPTRITEGLVDRYFELTLREGNRRALGERLRQKVWGADAERIGGVTQPTLILWGAEDRLIPWSVGEDLAARIAGSRLVRLEGLGHVPHEEDPERSFEPVRGFLGLP
jgi:pimeloyl-ACP methyl ester carboxylesterase